MDWKFFFPRTLTWAIRAKPCRLEICWYGSVAGLKKILVRHCGQETWSVGHLQRQDAATMWPQSYLQTRWLIYIWTGNFFRRTLTRAIRAKPENVVGWKDAASPGWNSFWCGIAGKKHDPWAIRRDRMLLLRCGRNACGPPESCEVYGLWHVWQSCIVGSCSCLICIYAAALGWSGQWRTLYIKDNDGKKNKDFTHGQAKDV